MFVFCLLALSILSPLVFLFPMRLKHTFVLVLVGVGAVMNIATACAMLLFDREVFFSGGANLIFGYSSFVIDELSALFMIIASISAVSVVVYAKGYLKEYLKSKTAAHISLHYMSLAILYFSMILVVISRDAYGFLFAWELMTISSFMLILFDAQRQEVWKAALNYLVLMHIGFVFLLAGFTVISSQGLPATFDSLSTYFAMNYQIPLFLLFLIGFGLKAGVFPLYSWLPEAHPAAPSHVSAFMSGVMIKMGVYGVMRVMGYMEDGLYTVGIILFVVGVVTGLWGAVFAAIQSDMKRLLAYSSIENIGIIFMAMGIGAIGYSSGNNFLALCGMGGALLHTANHSFFKTLLFFGVGNVYTATHTTSLDELGGLSRKMPVTAGLVLLGVAAISALPPLNGFVSEFLIYYGMFDAVAVGSGGILVAICGIVALALIGGIVIMAFTKLYGIAFLGSPRTKAVESAREVDRWRIVACFIPVVGILIVGLAPFLFTEGIFSIAGDYFDIIGAGEVYHSQMSPQIWKIASAVVVLVASVGGLLLYRYLKLRRRKAEVSPVWGCGFTAPNPRMQYTAESYSEGLNGTSTLGSSSDAVSKSEIFPSKRSFDIRHRDRIATLFSQWWIELIRRINVRVVRLNTGKVNHYVLYALMFLVLILLLSILNVI